MPASVSNSKFQTYVSPLGYQFPLLGSNHAVPGKDLIEQDGGDHIDLGPLKMAALSALDPSKSVCKFEIPGGGTCLDPQCSSIHLRDMEPSGALQSFFIMLSTYMIGTTVLQNRYGYS